MASLDTATQSLEQVLKIVDAGMAASLLVAATKANIFDDFRDKTLTPEALATKRQWDPARTERLLNGLASMKMLTRSEIGTKVEFGLTPSGHYLISDSPETIHEYVGTFTGMFYGEMNQVVNKYVNKDYIPDPTMADGGHDHGKDHDHGHGHGDSHKHGHGDSHKHGHGDSHKHEHGHSHEHGHGHSHEHGHGHSHGHDDDSSHGAGFEYNEEKMYRCMQNLMKPGLDKLLTAVDLSKYKTCIDLGGGTGAVAKALTRLNPQMKVTIIEMESVVKVAKQYFLTDKDDHVSIMPGDFFKEEIPKADLYVLSKVMHHWTTEQVDIMMKKMFNAINPGGALMFFEWCLYDNKDGPNTMAHTWDLMCLSDGGMCYSAKEFKQLMVKYGFKDFQFHRTSDHFHYDVVFARKPETKK